MARECERCEELSKCEIGKNECTICCTEYKPKQPLTNGDFLRICSTNSLARCIAKAMFFYDSQFNLTIVEALQKAIDDDIEVSYMIEKDVVEWLKETHKDS